jgi:nucleoside-diphosphate-sugar epimerase
LEDPPSFDVLFHLAAYAKPEQKSPAVRANDQGTENLLLSLDRRLRGTRVLYTGSIAIELRRNRYVPTSEAALSASSCFPRTEYGRSKLRGEVIVKERADQLGYTYTILRLPTVYGKGARRTGMFGLLPPLLQQQAWIGRVNWPGQIGLTHVEDVAWLLTASACHPATANHTFLVNSGEDPAFGEIAAHIAGILGLSRRPIDLSPGLLALFRHILRAWWIWKHAPHPAMIAVWRASFVLDGLTWDGSDITSLLGVKYRPWREAMRDMFAT